MFCIVQLNEDGTTLATNNEIRSKMHEVKRRVVAKRPAGIVQKKLAKM